MQGRPPQRCRGQAARSASQHVGGSPTSLSSCTRAEAPSKDTPVISLHLDGCTHLVGLARLKVLRDWTASQRERQMPRNPS